MTHNDRRRGVVVTGVSTGIGRAIAEDLMKAGYLVFGSVRRLNDATELMESFGTSFVPLLFDVTDSAALPAIVETVSQHLQGDPLAALINNAGVSLSGPLLLQPVEEFRKTFEVNVFGVLEVTRAFLPLLGASEQTGKRPGRIINIGSVAGAVTTPFMTAYSASKHAIEALSQGLRRELIPYGIEVSTIEPSFIRSSLFEKAATIGAEHRYQDTHYQILWQQFNRALAQQEAKAASPNKVTRAVLHALKSRYPRTRYPLDRIWYIGRCLPDRVFDKLIFKVLGIDRLILPSPIKKT
ncbi:SDR family oxidoreductase [Pseudomonas sp. N-137]|uniref:SDR family oxidoreductase n=1 Tax=Pseudomonas sp. N-137 TaxID=3108452 RepID=UPI002ADEEE42|nr:SDR family oxidoreductase [Pseudomonas sp. N-137]MEA1028072.1 SDR family oxidoreductase [Pseudomonas sp. N-137]